MNVLTMVRLLLKNSEIAPAMSLMKVSQRRLPPDAKGGWHQDAAVYGAEARTLNFWTPVSRCGDIAPSFARMS